MNEKETKYYTVSSLKMLGDMFSIKRLVGSAGFGLLFCDLYFIALTQRKCEFGCVAPPFPPISLCGSYYFQHVLLYRTNKLGVENWQFGKTQTTFRMLKNIDK